MPTPLPTSQQSPPAFLRDVSLVPVGSPGPSGRPETTTNVRIVDGVVQHVDSSARPERGDLIVDADGRWAIPGLWDAHVHLGQWSQSRSRLDVSGTTSAGEVAALVREHLRTVVAKGGEAVLIGAGYRSAVWPEPATVALLDTISPGVPVVLISGDSHNGWLNSAALSLLGVPPRNGVLEENEWFAVLARIADLPEVLRRSDEAYRDVVGAAAALGVVGVVDFEFEAGYREWPERFGRGTDQLRVRTATYPDRLAEVLAAGLRTHQELPAGGGLLTMGPLKVISDGSLNTRTASCCEPYADAGSSASPRGQPNLDRDELTELLTRARLGGLEGAVHAIGDAAVSVALDAYAASGAVGAIEHAQLVALGDLARMARLGVRASVQPAHLLDDRDVTARCWPDRSDRCFALQSLLAAGVSLALGSDAPVSPLDPWLAMAAAVHRSGDDREPWNPAEALTAAQALAASTDGRTTLTAGSRGDVVLLEVDPLAVAEDTAAVAQQLRQMRVAATFVAGRPTHLTL